MIDAGVTVHVEVTGVAGGTGVAGVMVFPDLQTPFS